MTRRPSRARSALLAVALLGAIGYLATAFAATGEAKGTLTHKNKTVTLKYAYLVMGPDAVDTKKTIRRLMLSAKDIGAKIQACQTMNCVDGEMTEGLEVDFDGGPRLKVWMAINGGLIQYSGTEQPAALKASADEPKRLAGKLAVDATSMGGPRVEAEFDATLLKELKAAR
jgi:hypothetical protein